MNSYILGKLYTLLEYASIKNEEKALLQKMLKNLSIDQQKVLLNALSDKKLLNFFVQNVLIKLGSKKEDAKKIIESEITILENEK